MRKKMISLPLGRILSFLLILLLPLPLYGQRFGKNKVNYDTFEWRVYQSPHFDIYYYPEEEAFLDDVLNWAENAYEFLNKRFNHKISQRIPFIFYKTHGEFEQTHVIPLFLPEGVGAFAEPVQNRMVVPLDDPPEKMLKLITHELTHIFEFDIFFQSNFLNAMRSNPPGWLMEGLAEHMADNLTHLDEMIVRDAVINDLIPELKYLNPRSGVASYVIGQVIWDFIASQYGEEGVRSFIWELRKVGINIDDIERAIEAVFKLKPEEFYYELRRHLRKKYLPFAVEKAEPMDYGKTVTPPDFRYPIFSPVTSPSGELAAALTIQKDDIDLVLISIKDGSIFRNLTPGFSGEYEYIIGQQLTIGGQGGRDISWSSDGNQIAFFGRTGNKRSLFLVDVTKGEIIRQFKLDIDQAVSPAISPDGRKVLFSGSQDGIRDIFLISMEDGTIENLTQDSFFDYSPIWSPDGKTVVYLSSINGYTKFFKFSIDKPEDKIQLTYGDYNDEEPIFTADGKMLLYSSDETGIYNIFALDLEGLEVTQHTDVLGGAFSPTAVDREGKKIAYISFLKGMYKLYTMNLDKPIRSYKIEPIAVTEEEALPVTQVKPTITYTVEEEKKSKQAAYKFFIENINVGGGVSSDGTLLSFTMISFSDMLGDHRFQLIFNTVRTYRNIGFTYLNQQSRLNYRLEVFDYKYYFLSPFYLYQQEVRNRVLETLTVEHIGGNLFFSYPLDKFHRAEFSVGYIDRTYDTPSYLLAKTSDPQFQNLQRLKSRFVSGKFVPLGFSFIGDTTLFKFFGPFSGKRYNLSVTYGPNLGEGLMGFADFTIDFRNYIRLTSGSLFAFRLFGGYSMGEAPNVYFFGGTNTMRGFDYYSFSGNRAFFANAELRFPLVDEIRFPVGFSLRGIRGVVFCDIGAAWFHDEDFQFLDPDDKYRLKDGRCSVGFGVNFFFGPLELHFDFARPTDFKSLAPNWRTSFWIGNKF
ncbi:MAG: hypothetical protein ACETWC_07495 [Acidobacteriota bacterium]